MALTKTLGARSRDSSMQAEGWSRALTCVLVAIAVADGGLGCGNGAVASTGHGDVGSIDAGTVSGELDSAINDGGMDGQSDSAKRIVGLATMGSTRFQAFGVGTPDNSMAELYAHPGIYVAAVINVTWQQVEPGQDTFDFSSIDAALGVLRSYNATYPTRPVVGKLRVWAGPNVPQWLIALAGGAVSVAGHVNVIQIARFWTPAYHAAWLALQDHLASTYNGNSMIQEVSVTSCSSQTFEPFIRPVDATSRMNMLQAGYTDEADLTCLQNALADFSSWTYPALDFPFNPFPHIDPPADGGHESVHFETDTPLQIMMSARAAIGDRLVLANEGLNDPIDPALQPLYSEFSSLGGPLQFQTYNPTVPWDATIKNGLVYKPSQIEIWDTTAADGGMAPLSASQLAGFAAALAAVQP